MWLWVTGAQCCFLGPASGRLHSQGHQSHGLSPGRPPTPGRPLPFDLQVQEGFSSMVLSAVP